MVAKEELAGEAWRLISEMFLSRRRGFVALAASLDLSAGDLETLLALEPGVPRAMRVLADSLHCDPSNVTWLIRRLEQHELVERVVHARDRRVKMVAMTEAGVEIQEQARVLLSQAPAELEALPKDVLLRLVQILKQVEPPPLTP